MKYITIDIGYNMGEARTQLYSSGDYQRSLEAHRAGNHQHLGQQQFIPLTPNTGTGINSLWPSDAMSS